MLFVDLKHKFLDNFYNMFHLQCNLSYDSVKFQLLSINIFLIDMSTV